MNSECPPELDHNQKFIFFLLEWQFLARCQTSSWTSIDAAMFLCMNNASCRQYTIQYSTTLVPSKAYAILQSSTAVASLVQNKRIRFSFVLVYKRATRFTAYHVIIISRSQNFFRPYELGIFFRIFIIIEKPGRREKYEHNSIYQTDQQL